jgi:hypothetical protein
MIVTSKNAVYYLIERGFLTYESAVDGDLMVVSSASNHRNTQVIRKNNPGFFMKQVQKWEMPIIGSLQREATCYWLAYNDDDFASITPLLPKYYYYDLNKHLLVIELLSDGENLFQYCLRIGACPVKLASQLAAALGTYHNQAGARMKQSSQTSSLTKTIPWILSIHQMPAAQATFNASSLGLLAYIQSNNQFYYALDALQKRWRYDSFIHGDIKFDNFIIESQNDADGEFSFKIIDWELAGFGDAGWDLGSAFQAFITFPLISMQTISSQLPTNMQGLMQLSSKEMRAAIREFWITYAGTLQINENALGEYLERSIKYGAARMMQLAFECMESLNGNEPSYHVDIIKAKAYCLAIVALDILQNPVNTLQSLFSE